MRISSVALACVVAVAGQGIVQAEVVGTTPALTPPAISLRGFPVAPGFANSGLANPGFAKPHDNVIRLAQSQEPASTGNPSVAPLKWVGYLVNPTPTATAPNHINYCTGQFIKPNVVLTAGHCLKDLQDNPTGPWFDLSKQYFILQYQNGSGSHTFKTVCGATNPLWAFPANYSTLSAADKDAALRVAAQHDFAMILVDGNSPTGVMPYALDWKGKVTDAVRIGYAIDILDGEIIQKGSGIVFFSDAIPMFTPQSTPGLVTHWASITDLTQGVSGGGWITNFSTTEGTGKNVLVSVSSFTNSNFPGAIFGAYLTAAEFNPLLTFVSNGCK
jgi:hypothetical protein